MKDSPMRCVLTLNAGSSSLKFALFGLTGMHQSRLLGGQIEAREDGVMFHVRDCVGRMVLDR